MRSFPEKIWVCLEPGCPYHTLRRYDMERHLHSKHRMYSEDARELSYRVEYRANPVVYQRNPQYNHEEQIR